MPSVYSLFTVELNSCFINKIRQRIGALKFSAQEALLEYLIQRDQFGLASWFFCSFFVEKNNRNARFLLIEKTGLLEDFDRLKVNLKSDLSDTLLIRRKSIGALSCLFLTIPQQSDFLPQSDYDTDQHFRYQQFIDLILRRLLSKNTINYLVESNWIYGNSRDWHEVAEKLGIKVLILLKEGWMSHSEGMARTIRHLDIRPFMGSKILTINESEKIRQIATKKVLKSQIVSVGSLRHDELLNADKFLKSPSRVVSILLPDFRPTQEFADSENLPRDYFDVIPGLQEFSQFLNNLNKEVLQDAVHLANMHSDYSVVVKVKVTKFSGMMVEQNLSEIKNVPNNLKLIKGGLSHKLLQTSRLAISYHSTAVIDCVSLGIPILVPYAYGIYPLREFCQDYLTCVKYFSNYQEISELISSGEERLDSLRDELILNQDRRMLLEQAIGNCDGRSGARATAEILNLIR